MMKTKIGISVGLFGAAIYFMGLFAGYMVLILLVGYALLFEENEWLKRTAVKSVVIYTCFSILFAIVGFIPDIIECIDGLCNIFEGSFHIAIVTRVVSFVQTILSIIEKALMLVLGFKALHQGTVKVRVVDKIVNKHMSTK